MASENKELDSNVLFCPDTVLGVIERTVEKALSNARFSLDAETQNNRKLHYVKVFSNFIQSLHYLLPLRDHYVVLNALTIIATICRFSEKN